MAISEVLVVRIKYGYNSIHNLWFKFIGENKAES